MQRSVAGIVLLVSALGVAYAQAPTGTIAGVVTDPTRTGVAEARVSLTNLQTAQAWAVETSAEGIYTAAALLPGEYRVSVEMPGFKRIDRNASVEAGTMTAVDFALELGSVTGGVTVRAAVPLLHYDHHQIGGVVRRAQIDNVPLNGRNFLELAKLEPGVTSPVRGAAGIRTFIATLGAGFATIPRIGYTRVTVDGASINALGVPGSALQLSSQVVEEFQLSTANFDVATSLTTNGSVNVVTRAGGNEYRGDVLGFYRDHHLSAYPGLRRDRRNSHPFFERRQLGTAIGGPLRRNRAFFFASYERNNQQGVATVQPGALEFAPLGGIFGTPAVGDLFSARIDGRLASKHTLVARYTRDASSAFGPIVGVLPSGWTNQLNEAYQGVISLTSLLPREIVNGIRLSYFHIDSQLSAADSITCAGCFGLGEPRISVSGGGLTFGTSPNAFSFVGSRYELSENLSWRRGRHQLRFGFVWEHSITTYAVPDADLVQITVWSPEQVREVNQTAPPDAQISLPPSFAAVGDVLQLPLRRFEIAVGSGRALERDFRPYRTFDMYRLYAGDTWRIGPALTLNSGLGWSYEPNALNHHLTKPPLLIPLLGEGGLNAPPARVTNFSPMLGFAWTATSDAKTIVRGGIGRYFDPAGSTNSIHLGNERLFLSPLGTGRLAASGSNIRWNGSLLDFPKPTAVTAAQLLTILPGIRADLAGALNPENRDFKLRNINRTKEGANLYDPSYDLPSAVHISAGIQHELANQFVLSTDIVWKRFSHTFINGIDYNRFNSAQGPLIGRCSETARDDVHAMCSNGPIMFDTTSGRARYAGVLVRAEARVAPRAQLLASYALGSYVGSNGTTTGTVETNSGRATGFNNDDWFENYGPLPTDLRHILNLSGYLALPWRFQLAFSLSATSAPPFTAWLEDVDINGDGTNDDLLPGTKVNELGRGLGKEDLQRLVEAYNQRFAATALCCGQTAPRLTLPSTYAFNDTFVTQDLRITRVLPLGSERARLLVFGEVFNLFNTANLMQYSGNLLERSTFGQPAGRFTQIFGSGGPRAFQLGARVSF